MERMVRLAARLRKELSTNKDRPFNLRMLSRSPRVMLPMLMSKWWRMRFE